MCLTTLHLNWRELNSEQHRVQPVLGLAKLPFMFAFTPCMHVSHITCRVRSETFYAVHPPGRVNLRSSCVRHEHVLRHALMHESYAGTLVASKSTSERIVCSITLHVVHELTTTALVLACSIHAFLGSLRPCVWFARRALQPVGHA